MKYVLMNPKANNGMGEQDAREWAKRLTETCNYVDVVSLPSMADFVAGLKPDDEIILTGGDGTLNHFANDLADVEVTNKIYYVKCGSGNDFYNDNKHRCDELGRIYLNDMLRNLPVIEVNGLRRRFINGIGYGIDGETCRVGEELRLKSTKRINYTNIAVKLLMGGYKLRRATVTVDGETYEYKNVWMAPTMQGRFYGGGMMVAPDQDRLNAEHKVTVVVAHKRSRLGTLMVFPSIFEGKHVLKKGFVTVFTGKKVTVTFDKPCALQIDGEVVHDVTTYSVETVE